jgi:hypothetical protein
VLKSALKIDLRKTMINLGRYNNLTITALLDDGCLLDGGASGSIKLKEVGEFQIGDWFCDVPREMLEGSNGW